MRLSGCLIAVVDPPGDVSESHADRFGHIHAPAAMLRSSVAQIPGMCSGSFVEGRTRSMVLSSATWMLVLRCLRAVSLATLPDVLYGRALAYLSPEG